MDREIEKIRKAAAAAALGAGEILLKYFGRIKHLRHKGEIDIVTEADILSEKFIVCKIMKEFPSHGILAEENSRFNEAAEYLWVIDPLDGTVNYAHTYPLFNVSIGILRNGKPVAGVVYDPIRREMFTAVAGGGALLNGRRIGVSATGKLRRSLLVTGFSYDVAEDRRNIGFFSKMLLKSQAVRRDGSAALDLCFVACGRYDGFWELKLNPWDVAAGSLILTEAGGRVSDFCGGKFDIRAGEILSSNGLIHRQMVKILSGH